VELAMMDGVARQHGKVLVMKGWKNRVNVEDSRNVFECCGVAE